MSQQASELSLCSRLRSDEISQGQSLGSVVPSMNPFARDGFQSWMRAQSVIVGISAQPDRRSEWAFLERSKHPTHVEWQPCACGRNVSTLRICTLMRLRNEESYTSCCPWPPASHELLLLSHQHAVFAIAALTEPCTVTPRYFDPRLTRNYVYPPPPTNSQTVFLLLLHLVNRHFKCFGKFSTIFL